jgi:hypothetical protein
MSSGILKYAFYAPAMFSSSSAYFEVSDILDFYRKLFFLELHHWFDLVERNGHWGDLSHFFVVLGFAHFFRQFTFSIFAIYLDRFRLGFIKIYEGTRGNWNFDLFFVYPIVNSKYQAILFFVKYRAKEVLIIRHKLSHGNAFIINDIVKKLNQYIENPAYASNFITTSQIEKWTNEITGFLTIV